MTEKKKQAVTSDEIAAFLSKTGFIFEMRATDALVTRQYECDVNSTFLDLEGGVEREIDIIARKQINGITLHLVIECKQSAVDKWVFICTKSDAARYHYATKHLPHVGLINMKELFSHFHYFDRRIPVAHNYICYSLSTNKKGDDSHIDHCVHKLPKALVHVALRAGQGRHVFVPLALFSGQMFTVSYKNAPSVEERDFLQYSYSFESKMYTRLVHTRTDPVDQFSSDEDRQLALENQLRNAALRLGSPYQIDFVSESGLSDYLARVEKEIALVNIRGWLDDSTTA